MPRNPVKETNCSRLYPQSFGRCPNDDSRGELLFTFITTASAQPLVMQKAGSREPYLIPAREQIRKTFVQTPHHQPTETIRNSSLEYCVPRLGAADCQITNCSSARRRAQPVKSSTTSGDAALRSQAGHSAPLSCALNSAAEPVTRHSRLEGTLLRT